MSTLEPRHGVRVWALLALPLVAQFAFVALGASILAQSTDAPPKASFYNLPHALLLLAAYIVFGLTSLIVARRLGNPRIVLAVRRTRLLRAIGLGGLALVVGIAVAALLEPIFHGSANQQLDPGPFPGTTASFVAVVLSGFTVIVGAALTEELYFRGLLYGHLDQRWGVAAAIVGSASVFGLVHFQPNTFPTLFALGLILGVLRLRTASIWPGVAVHAGNNTLAFLILLLAAA